MKVRHANILTQKGIRLDVKAGKDCRGRREKGGRVEGRKKAGEGERKKVGGESEGREKRCGRGKSQVREAGRRGVK